MDAWLVAWAVCLAAQIVHYSTVAPTLQSFMAVARSVIVGSRDIGASGIDLTPREKPSVAALDISGRVVAVEHM